MWCPGDQEAAVTSDSSSQAVRTRSSAVRDSVDRSLQCCVAKMESSGHDFHSVRSQAMAHASQGSVCPLNPTDEYWSSALYVLTLQLEGENTPQIFTECLCCVLVAQSHPTLWDTMNCSPPGSSVHGILQAGILE